MERIRTLLDDIEPEYVSQQGDPEALRTAMINAARNAMAPAGTSTAS